MKKSMKIAGIVVLAAGVLTYPAIKLYQYIANRGAEDAAEGEEHAKKRFARAYRGKNRPHHRHAENGHLHDHA